MDHSILNVAFYRFVDVPGYADFRELLKSRAVQLGIRGSILLSREGINAFLAGQEQGVRDFIHYFEHLHPGYSKFEVKESWSETIPFTRMLVKLKKEIISLGMHHLDPKCKTGPRVEPGELKSWLDQNPDEVVMIDTRNDYEIKLGTFKNAVDYNLKTFRQFPKFLDENRGALEGKKVVMFCTGGIRCEKATSVAMDLGIPNVYQLEGGILKYFEKVGGSHYNGDCFVFDKRVSLKPDLSEADAVQCYGCRSPLSRVEIDSLKYVPGKSCPHCDLERVKLPNCEEDKVGVNLS